VQARIRWTDDLTFVGESGSGHAIVIDGPPDAGGKNLGPRPMELVLLGVGSCAAVDVVHILKKARTAVTGCVVELKAERAPADPKVFTAIHLHFVVSGRDLPAHQVERAIKLSAEKYCSASIMMAAGGVKVTHDFELRTAGP
jgi:putative redox protein